MQEYKTYTDVNKREFGNGYDKLKGADQDYRLIYKIREEEFVHIKLGELRIKQKLAKTREKFRFFHGF